MLRSFGKWCVGLVAAVAIGTGAALAADILKNDDLVAICGDSITEQKDYSVDIEAYLLMCRAGGPVRAAQFGWGGDSMGWLWGRGGPKDILAFKPAVVTTCYGMNDGGYKAVTDKTLSDYRNGMLKLMQTFKENGVRTVVVGSPGAVDSTTFHHNPEDAAVYNKTLAAMSDVAKEVAQQSGNIFADVHDPMMDVMAKAKAKYGQQYHLAGGDGVHPASNGQLVMAYAFLKAMGLDGEIGTITVDLKSSQASASEGHKVLSSKDGEVQVESSRYPYCFWGNPSDPNATAGVIAFFPFNEDLNRFKLVVTNAPAEKMKVTWGKTSKEYTAQELAKGINLAADFIDNPFSAQFTKLRDGIRRKQEYETMVYKTFLPNAVMMQEALKDSNPQSTAYDELKAAMLKRDGKMGAELAKQVTPVTHSIKIEAVQ